MPASLLAFIAILIFSGTPVATRVGLTSFSPWFLFAFRSAVAAVVGIVWVRWRQLPRPRGIQLRWLLFSGLGVVIGFPLLTALALRYVDASHAAVITATVPLFTALSGAWLHGRRPSVLFWILSCTAVLLVAGFFFASSGGRWTPADALILIASASVGLGYGFGALAGEKMSSDAVIAWTLILFLPLTLQSCCGLGPVLVRQHPA